jgi:hypothetical protein
MITIITRLEEQKAGLEELSGYLIKKYSSIAGDGNSTPTRLCLEIKELLGVVQEVCKVVYDINSRLLEVEKTRTLP